MANTTTAAPAAAPPRVTPTVSQSVRVPWGDWLEQALVHETAIIEATAVGAENLVLKSIPMGAVVSMFIGPTIIKQYVDMALTSLEGILEPMGTDVPASSPWIAAVANLINTNEPKFAAWVGDELEPMIKAALARVGISV